MDKICVIGFPSKLGGADTELDHQIRCWQSLGIQVHLLHTGPLDGNLLAMKMQDRKCIIHEPCDWSACRDMHVISYCNGEFPKHLHLIKDYAKSTTFVNCMCWLFDAEKEAHRLRPQSAGGKAIRRKSFSEFVWKDVDPNVFINRQAH